MAQVTTAKTYIVYGRNGRTIGFTNDDETATQFQLGGYIVVQED